MDLKRLSLIVGITIGMAGIATGVFKAIMFVSGVQTIKTATAQHESIRIENAAEHKMFETKEAAGQREEGIKTILKSHESTNRQILDELKINRQRTWEILRELRH